MFNVSTDNNAIKSQFLSSRIFAFFSSFLCLSFIFSHTYTPIQSKLIAKLIIVLYSWQFVVVLCPLSFYTLLITVFLLFFSNFYQFFYLLLSVSIAVSSLNTFFCYKSNAKLRFIVRVRTSTSAATERQQRPQRHNEGCHTHTNKQTQIHTNTHTHIQLTTTKHKTKDLISIFKPCSQNFAATSLHSSP